MRNAPRTAITENSLKTMAKIIEQAGQGDDKSLGVASVMLIAFWPDGTLSYGGIVGSIGSKAALATALEIQAENIRQEIVAAMHRHTEERLAAMKERDKVGAPPQ